MPSGKLIAWIVGLSLATTVAFQTYAARKSGGPGPLNRPAR